MYLRSRSCGISWRRDVSSDKCRVDCLYLSVKCGTNVHFIVFYIKLWMTPQMTADDKTREELILHGVYRVLDDTEHVKAGQDRLGELHVLLERDRRVVPAADRIRRGDDGAARLERGDDARLGYRDGLLLHGLVYRRAVRIVHLVKLVDQAVALVREHERPALKCPLARDWVLAHARRQTDCGRTLTGREDGSVRGLLDVLEELRLGRTWVSQEENVDVPSEAKLAVDVLGNAAEERGLLPS